MCPLNKPDDVSLHASRTPGDPVALQTVSSRERRSCTQNCIVFIIHTEDNPVFVHVLRFSSSGYNSVQYHFVSTSLVKTNVKLSFTFAKCTCKNL